MKAGQIEFADIFLRLERDFKMKKAAVAPVATAATAPRGPGFCFRSSIHEG
jgi:hypothetical protein